LNFLDLLNIIKERTSKIFFETKNLEREIVLQIAYSILLIIAHSSLQYAKYNLSREYYITKLIN